MTRAEFYLKCLIIIVIGSVWVPLSPDKEAMWRHVYWTMVTITAYIVWHDCSVIPESWKFWRKP
jgi:hypothetical protein